MRLRYKIAEKISHIFVPSLKQTPSYDEVYFDDQRIRELARLTAAEGSILLKNENHVLPINHERIAVFGRHQYNYFFTGYGSGGDVKTLYKTSLIEGLIKNGFNVDKNLADIYEKWCIKHVPSDGVWGFWPHSYEEYNISNKVIKEIASRNDIGIYVLGRSSGEDRDNKLKKGSWYLSSLEMKMLKRLRKEFKKLVVIINSATIIDFSWLEKIKPDSVLLAYQGGQESGEAIADILNGTVSPSGKLTTTIAKYEDYPSSDNFDHIFKTIYQEDIYVGYRYFETFKPNKVIFPFGYGLTYSEFAYEANIIKQTNNNLIIEVQVTNIGKIKGKEVIQLYYSSPQGKLGKPKIELYDFEKTKELLPGQSDYLFFELNINDLASFDDQNQTNNQSCFVLEKGNYTFYIGNSIRNIKQIHSIDIEKTEVIKKVNEICSIKKEYERLINRNGIRYLKVKRTDLNLKERILNNLPKEIKKLNGKSYTLQDVLNKKCDIDEFISQLSEEELINLSKGSNEGMNSSLGPKGNAGVFGGTTSSLKEKGIPVISTNDGPSGVRLHRYSTLLPIGTCLASTFDKKLITELTYEAGKEMKHKGCDVLLAPGINIIRNPLCGRNFEYYSEDPRLTGKIANAYIKGLHKAKVMTAVKHFACNNQEKARMINDSIVSNRALREIYLKAFEMCITESKPEMVMMSYNKVNGVYNSYNYDLATTVLRNEWKYEGTITTDWWVMRDHSKEFPKLYNHAYRIRAGVNLFMPGVGRVFKKDCSIEKGLVNGLTKAELQNNVKYILKVCMIKLEQEE